jgi:hypothetical protein
MSEQQTDCYVSHNVKTYNITANYERNKKKIIQNH